jgi:hypothetical protein
MAANITPESLSLLINAQIAQDQRNGAIPMTVRTFAELHDYVDANEYILNVLEAAEIAYEPASFDQADLMNEAMDLTDAWLNRRGKQ